MGLDNMKEESEVPEESQIPKNLKLWQPDETTLGGMSNFDDTIDDGFEEALLKGKHYGQHSAWNFCGYIWWDDCFHEEIWRYNSPIEVISDDTLEGLREKVNDKYGWE